MATHNAKAGSQPRLTWARCKLTSWRRTSGARRGRRASNPCITRSKSAGCTLRCRRRRRENVPDRLGRRAGTGKVPMHLTLSVWTFRPLAVGLGSRYSRGSRRVPAPLPALYNRTSPRPTAPPVRPAPRGAHAPRAGRTTSSRSRGQPRHIERTNNSKISYVITAALKDTAGTCNFTVNAVPWGVFSTRLPPALNVVCSVSSPSAPFISIHGLSLSLKSAEGHAM